MKSSSFRTRAARFLLMLSVITVIGGAWLVAQAASGGGQARSRSPKTPARGSAPAAAVDWTAVQVALDRRGFSPGEIDGRPGANTRRALAAWGTANGTPPAGDETGVAERLLSDAEPPLTAYRIGEADVAGPFTPEIPADLVEQGSLPALGYRTPLEAIAERFHASPSLIQRLNPGARFGAGDTLQVPSVDPLVLPAYSGVRKPQEAGATPAGRIVVDTETSALTAYDQQGALLLHVPVTTGSEHDPLPVGEWKVLGVFWMPKFHYNPALFWDADPAHAKTTIAPGPNNPVGVAWIDINKEHYGLHGTPEPGTIGHRTSHGCIRMTNWDVLRVASLVTKGTVVIFQ